MATEGQLKRTALHTVHKALGAKMVAFAGWEMPLEYSGVIREHMAVRTQAGLFDVSHMGEIEVRGEGALALVQHLTSNDASRLRIGQAQYTALMFPQGSAVDDCILHRLAEEHFLFCVNAASRERDVTWVVTHNSFRAEVRDASADYTQLALQGPRAPAILARVTDADLSGLRYYWFCRATCCGVECLVARTGYTGEDGFELYFSPVDSERIWNTLLEAGREHGLVPAGLAARNTLRLEAAYALYGHELDDGTTLLEANLDWICKFEKGDFIGRDALLRQRQQGLRKKLVGFEMLDRSIARDGYAVWMQGKQVGYVTSASPAPFLRKNLGMAYVPPDLAVPGREMEIEIRGRRAPARQVPLPFYRRPK